MRSLLAVLAVLALSACNPQYRLGAKDGIPNVTGSTEVNLDAFVCGNPIQAGEYTVATKKVTNGCELSFDKDVEVLKSTDYSRIPSLTGASNLLQAVELTINRLAFTDSATGQPLDAATRITSATLSINGQQVADKSTLAALPKTATLSGNALTPLKAKVDARMPASVKATSVVVLPDAPAPPKKLKIDYDAQPTLVLGTGEIKLP
jgi:hypothetical protein